MTADQRLSAAREYLDGARNRPVPTLPPSVMMRELAETRRQLGIVLHVLDGAVVLDDDQAATVTAALDDAVAGIRDRAARCGDCEISPAGLCQECFDRLARVELYADLAHVLPGAR